MHEEKPSFTIEKDEIGLGKCVIAQWPDGRRKVVTGFGTKDAVKFWIDRCCGAVASPGFTHGTQEKSGALFMTRRCVVISKIPAMPLNGEAVEDGRILG